MHPLLMTRRRLLLYLQAWAVVLALLVNISAAAGTPWLEALTVFAPAVFVFAFICLSPWPICRARPLGPAALPGLLVTFSVAASVGSLALVGTAAVMAAAISRPGVLRGQIVGVVFVIGVLIYLLSTGLHYAMIAAEASRDAERRAAEARTLAREAELHSLRIQLNPHFLFNSLHSISALATIDGGRARDMCIKLAAFLRSSLGLGDRASIPIREEVQLARSYLEVEQVRFGDRLRVEAEIDPACEACGIPPLLLQPLVENAVKHGIAGLIEGGEIRLTAQRDGGAVAIIVENAFDLEAPPRRDLGIGLTHVKRRLEVRYGSEATFDARPFGAVYRVALRLPCA
jgi:two-component system, LytTR family, sensor histidine kinase AlgZ